MMTPYDIKWLHVESSSKCNAWCPLCPRNIDGNQLHPKTVEQDLDLTTLKNIIQQLPNLFAIQFCGNHGDPIAAKTFLEMIDIVKPHVKKIQIHTNGSLRNAEWWKFLALKLKDIEHDVWFGIDGLEQTHEIYRQGTDFNKIITNAKSFIDNGGYATWQFIPFEHNEHQIKDCIKLSQKLKFAKFKFVRSLRNQTNVIKKFNSEEFYKINAPVLPNKIIQIENNKQKIVLTENCMHLSNPSVYLDVTGKLSYCCYYMSNWAAQKIMFDSLQELFYNNINLSYSTCTNSCGT